MELLARDGRGGSQRIWVIKDECCHWPDGPPPGLYNGRLLFPDRRLIFPNRRLVFTNRRLIFTNRRLLRDVTTIVVICRKHVYHLYHLVPRGTDGTHVSCQSLLYTRIHAREHLPSETHETKRKTANKFGFSHTYSHLCIAERGLKKQIVVNPDRG